MLPTVKRTWAPKGQTPIFHHRTRSYKKVSGIGGLSVSPQRRRLGLYLHWYPDANITQQEVLRFLRDILVHFRGNVIVLWDRIATHRAKMVQRFIKRHRRLTVDSFPPYAPELNPQEGVWGYLKWHQMPNHGICELDSLHDRVHAEGNSLRSRQPLLRSFVIDALPMRFP